MGGVVQGRFGPKVLCLTLGYKTTLSDYIRYMQEKGWLLKINRGFVLTESGIERRDNLSKEINGDDHKEETIKGVHDESKLPKWAQKRIADLKGDIDSLRSELLRTKAAHSILFERTGWFTINGPSPSCVKEGTDMYNLFYLSNEGSHAVCSLREGDIVLVGRKEK